MLRWLWRPASRGWSPRWRAPARGKSWRRDRAIACSQATLPCGRGADAATMASWVVTWGAGRSSGRCKAGDRFRNDQHEDRYRGGRLDHVHVLNPRGENLCHPGVEAKADHDGRVQIVVEAGVSRRSGAPASVLQYERAKTTTFMTHNNPASTSRVAAPVLPVWRPIVPRTFMTDVTTLISAAHTAIPKRIRIGRRLPSNQATMTTGRNMPARPTSHCGWKWPSVRAEVPRSLTRSEAAKAMVPNVSSTAMVARAMTPG